MHVPWAEAIRKCTVLGDLRPILAQDFDRFFSIDPTKCERRRRCAVTHSDGKQIGRTFVLLDHHSNRHV